MLISLDMLKPSVIYRCDACFYNREHPCFLITNEDDSDVPKNCPYGGVSASWEKQED